jgi:hypothetical protein
MGAVLGDERCDVDIEAGAHRHRWTVSREAIKTPPIEAVSMSGEAAERVERNGGQGERSHERCERWRMFVHS